MQGVLHLTLQKDSPVLLPGDPAIVVAVIDGPLQVDLLRVPLVLILHDPFDNLHASHLAVTVCIDLIHPPREEGGVLMNTIKDLSPIAAA